MEQVELSRVFASVPGVVWDLPGIPDDPTLRASFVSPFSEQILGYATSAWLSEPGFWLTLVHPQDKERAAREIRDIYDRRASGVSQFRWIASDGRVLWMLTFGNVSSEQEAPHFRGITFDLTPYRLAVQRLGVQHAVTMILAEASSLEDAARSVLRAIGESLEWQLGLLWTGDAGGTVLHNTAAWAASPPDYAEFLADSRNRTFAPGEGLPGRVWATQRSAWIADVAADDNFPRASEATRASLHAAFAFPITLGGSPLAVVEFFSTRIVEPSRELLDLIDGVAGQFAQFAERKRAELAVQDSARRLRQIVESALDAVIEIDAAGIIQEWNPQAASTFGWLGQEAVGRRLSSLIIPERYRERHEDGLANAALTGEGAVIGSRIEIEALHRSGREFPVELTIVAARSLGRFSFTAFVRDISERRRQEQMKDDVLGFASHELKSPLTVVVGLSKWLTREVTKTPHLTEDALGAIETLSTEADRLAHMLEQILDLTRLDASQLVLDLTTVDLITLVREEGEALTAQHPHVSVTLEANEEQVLLESDEIGLRRIIANLLNNAAKYGGEQPEITVAVARTSDLTTIVVQDRGQGIKDDDLLHVFDRFYRGVDEGGQKGLGIGLFLTKAIVERLGGAIMAANRERGGAEFTVTLPAHVIHS